MGAVDGENLEGILFDPANPAGSLSGFAVGGSDVRTAEGRKPSFAFRKIFYRAKLYPRKIAAGTAAGDAYTFSEFDQMFRDAGFGESVLKSLDPIPQRLILTSN